MDKLDDVARRFVALLDQFGAPYAIMGGMAVRLYGLPRATYDVDFVATIPRDRLAQLFIAADQRGFAIPDAQRTGWIDSVRSFAVIKFQSYADQRSVDVDVFLVESPFQQSVLKRRQLVSVDGWDAWYVTAEDLILLKLLAGRKKDQADVADILLVQGQLDEAYLRDWAAKLSVAAELESALSERPD